MMNSAISKDRLAWFPCYSEKLLGALVKMDPQQGYIYVITLLRIYEVGGPIDDSAYVLSRRSGIPEAKVKRALENLIASGKLITADGMISNPEAEKIISDSNVVSGGRSTAASKAAKARWKKDNKNNKTDMPRAMPDECVGDASDMPQNAQLQLQEQKKEKTGKKEKAARADRATRIPEDWKLTSELGNYGLSRGLHRNEVLNEAEKFVRYWKGVAGQKGRKLDWKATWEKWCISTAERLGRQPKPAPGKDPAKPENFDRAKWEFVMMMFENTNNWRREWGPEPGPNCCMPPDLLERALAIAL